MKAKHHFLKTETAYFRAVEIGTKKFELRKNDRDFQPGDSVCLLEIKDGVATGKSLPHLQIQYVFVGGEYGLDPGYCIFNW